MTVNQDGVRREPCTGGTVHVVCSLLERRRPGGPVDRVSSDDRFAQTFLRHPEFGRGCVSADRELGIGRATIEGERARRSSGGSKPWKCHLE
jgi:hypothetical protein